MNDFPEPDWQDVQSFLEKEGFVEIKFDENWYIFTSWFCCYGIYF